MFLVVTPERLEAFIPTLLSKIHVEGLIHGNYDKKVCCIFYFFWVP